MLESGSLGHSVLQTPALVLYLAHIIGPDKAFFNLKVLISVSPKRF